MARWLRAFHRRKEGGLALEVLLRMELADVAKLVRIRRDDPPAYLSYGPLSKSTLLKVLSFATGSIEVNLRKYDYYLEANQR